MIYKTETDDDFRVRLRYGGPLLAVHRGQIVAIMETDVYLDCSSNGDGEPLEDLITEIRSSCDGWNDVRVGGNGWMDRDRDESGAEIELAGWRPGTPEEIAGWQEARDKAATEAETKRLAELQKKQETKKLADKAALARARAAFPDLFKD